MLGSIVVGGLVWWLGGMANGLGSGVGEVVWGWCWCWGLVVWGWGMWGFRSSLEIVVMDYSLNGRY